MMDYIAEEMRDAVGHRVAQTANDVQIGGDHYKGTELQHWDLAVMYDWDPFQYQVTKYVMRWKKKNGLQDLRKALHFLEKYIEVYEHYLLVQKNPGLVAAKNVKPTGYQGFTYEGGTVAWDLYRCTACGAEVRPTPGEDPHNWHQCPMRDGNATEATSAYTNQG